MKAKQPSKPTDASNVISLAAYRERARNAHSSFGRGHMPRQRGWNTRPADDGSNGPEAA